MCIFGMCCMKCDMTECINVQLGQSTSTQCAWPTSHIIYIITWDFSLKNYTVDMNYHSFFCNLLVCIYEA